MTTKDAHPFSDFLDLLEILPERDDAAIAQVRQRDAMLTKPAGSLGKMETLVEWLAGWQGKGEPTLDAPMVAIFAGNHGVAARGVSAFPPEVTSQMVENFRSGGAAINQICILHEINIRIFELALEVPTGDITIEPAMDERTCAATLAYGMEATAGEPDLLCIGEMGIGNTTIAAAIYAALFGGTGADWVGRGTGVDDEGLQRKGDAVDAALRTHEGNLNSPLEVLRRLGGREIAAMAGAILSARHRKTPVIIDGFIATSAAAILHAANPATLDHCLFAHTSAESAHAEALVEMGKEPYLDLGLRLGEGTGAALLAVMAKTALFTHKNMATFGDAGVAEKSETLN